MNDTATIEPGGMILRGIAVPWNQPTVVAGPNPRGSRIVHQEMFDERSIVGIGVLRDVPLMVNHDDGRPAGRVRLSRSTERGLEVECDLVGSDDEVEGIRRRLANGLQAKLSIGFYPNPKADEWETRSSGELPLVRRRGVKIKEISLVHWPAYEGALVTGVHVRNSIAEQRHRESDEEIVATQLFLADLERRRAERSA